MSRQKLLKVSNTVNNAIKHIPTKNITETNNLIYAAMITTTELLGVERTEMTVRKKDKKQNVPPWKRRMDHTMQKKRKDLSRLVQIKENTLKNQKIKEDLTKRYLIGNLNISEVIEILKQQILALKTKIERFANRCKFFKDNKKFETNQRRFYQDLDKEKQESSHQIPDKKKTLEFWSKIWESNKGHKKEAKWILELEEINKSVPKQNNITITTEKIRKASKKMKNWKAAGPDNVQGFWIKNLTNTHERLANHLQIVLDGNKPNWLVTGRTSLILKNPEEPLNVSNYRPITCLTTTWKLLTSILADEIYDHLDKSGIIPWQQKGCKRKSRGTKDQLLIDKLITRHAKQNKRNLRMVWIDYKKAYDSVPHSWILKCLKLYGIADNIINFIADSMKLWKTTLTILQEVIGEILINCGIFQGDSLSPILFIICLIPLSQILDKTKTGYKINKKIINHLLYMDDLKLYAGTDKQINSLVNTVRIFSEDIQMKFGLEKCAKAIVNRGKIAEGDHMEIQSGKSIRNLELDEKYKYLGILESDQIANQKIKEDTSKEYKRRIRAILKTKLNGRNQISAINIYAIPVITYTAGIINWTKEELKKLDRITRKEMTINGALHPRADVDRLYVPRKRGGRGLMSIEEVVQKEENALALYTHNSNEMFIKMVNTELYKDTPINTNQFRTGQIQEREDKWKNKKLHGKWYNIQNKANEKTNDWLTKSNLKPATEALITAAQDQALNTKWHNTNILGRSQDSLCRRCHKHQETVQHIIAGCPELAQTAYLNRHNQVASFLHWSICQRENLPCCTTWYEHLPEKITENEKIKILYDFTIYTDKKIPHNRPDIVIVNKAENSTLFIDVACPMDQNIQKKEKEKIEKYQDLKFEIERIWKTKVNVVPIVVGALGAISDNFKAHLQDIGLDSVRTCQLQKPVLLKTGYILRRHRAI